MKKEFLIIPKYLLYIIILTIIASSLFVLYPFTTSSSINFNVYMFQIFLSVALYTLPLMAVISLMLVLLFEIKTGYSSFLSFLIYIFLCLFTWLILIPLFIFFEPATIVSGISTNKNPYLYPFFNKEFLQIIIDNLKFYEIDIHKGLIKILSDISLFCKQVIIAIEKGKIGYLLFASIGLALSSLYALKNVSQWKLINVATIFTIWCTIIFTNIYLFKYIANFYFTTEMLACIINIVFTIFICITGIVNSKKKKNKNQLVSGDE